MPPSSGSSLALAARLRSLDDGVIVALLNERGIRTTGVRDFFDLADRLLAPESVHEALSHLDRPTLAALAAGGASPALASLALADPEGVPYDAVREVLTDWPRQGLPSAAQLAEPAPPALAVIDASDRTATNAAAGERAYATTVAVRELLDELAEQPARELVRGGIALPDAKRLASAAQTTLDDVPGLLTLCATAGLAVLVGGEWTVTDTTDAWLRLPIAQRWGRLAESWAASLQPDVHALLGDRVDVAWGEGLTDYVAWLYPAGGDWMRERVATHVASAERLGIVSDGLPSAAGAALFASDLPGAEAAVAEHFPHEVEKAYLQNDLTIVATGPLVAARDVRLRRMARAEGTGLAGSYRLSAETLERALAGGETAEGIRDFLSDLSLTGLPQPLAYLIDETARRHGLVRVGSEGVGCYVRSPDTDLLHTIAVDQRLAALGLRDDVDRLTTNLSAEIVYWALLDARYPVSLEDDAGAVLERRRPTSAATTATREDPATALVARLRENDVALEGGGWLERQLDTAIRARVAVTVTVQLPGGEQVQYVLEPTGLGGGRLRARDRAADIERTLPLSSILEVDSAP